MTTVSPSDPRPMPPFVLAGRVVALDGPARAVTVADAFVTLTVTLTGAGDLAVELGDLVEVDIVGVGVGVETSTGSRPGDCIGARARVVGRDRRPRDVRPEGGEHARLGARGRGANLRDRARALAAVRAFFAERGYLEVETPAAVPSPGLDLHLDAYALSPLGPAPRFLITSPEYQMKRLLVAGVPRCFQIARCFRPGELGARHNPEFTMLEWYRASSGIDAMIAETEALLVAVATAVRGKPEVVSVREGRARTVALTTPFERLPLADAFARHAGISSAEALSLGLSGSVADEERFFRLLVERVEPALADGPPVVLVDYPIRQASLARPRPDDGRLAERFELFVDGVELCNGFGELVDADVQRARLLADQAARAAVGKPVYPIDERFLAALEEGMPPSAGNALGLDRLVALCVGASTIGDVQAFPEGWL